MMLGQSRRDKSGHCRTTGSRARTVTPMADAGPTLSLRWRTTAVGRAMIGSHHQNLPPTLFLQISEPGRRDEDKMGVITADLFFSFSPLFSRCG